MTALFLLHEIDMTSNFSSVLGPDYPGRDVMERRRHWLIRDLHCVLSLPYLRLAESQRAVDSLGIITRVPTTISHPSNQSHVILEDTHKIILISDFLRSLP